MIHSDDQWVLEDQPSASIEFPSKMNGVVKAIILGLVAAVVVVLALGVHWYLCSKHAQQQSHRNTQQTPVVVPFVVLHDSLPSFGNRRKQYHEFLRSIQEQYKTEGSRALAGLSSMLDEALATEASLNLQSSNSKFLSAKIYNRIQRTAECIEHDERVVRELLGNFDYVLALPDNTTTANRSNTGNSTDANPPSTNRKTNFRIPGTTQHTTTAPIPNASDTHSYDSATQIVAHLVRDWTQEGKPIRRALYDWCREQLTLHSKPHSTVLVPGSGMGRLAYELSLQGHTVEANELSPSMAVAAQAVLTGKVSGILHPYLLDAMANEVDSARRFATASFPDVKRMEATNLSYTVGNFVGGEKNNNNNNNNNYNNNNNDYYHRERANAFDAIVTCFFIDTATNIYEYLQAMENLLTRTKNNNGVWINVGPVQWHHNALLRPSVDELKDLLEACGWTLKHWSIDTKPISYRDQLQQTETQGRRQSMLPPMTSYDGYRPLRFVAIRSN